MNLNMIPPKNEIVDLLLSKYKNCETLIEQTHRKAEGSLEFKPNKSRETFHFQPLISIEVSWMIGLTSLEVYNSIFNITGENNNFKQYKNLDQDSGGVSYEKIRDSFKKNWEFRILQRSI